MSAHERRTHTQCFATQRNDEKARPSNAHERRRKESKIVKLVRAYGAGIRRADWKGCGRDQVYVHAGDFTRFEESGTN